MDTEDYRETAGGLEPSLVSTGNWGDARSEVGSEYLGVLDKGSMA